MEHVRHILTNISLGDIALILTVMGINIWTMRFGIWPYSLVTFPGTLAHECSHFLFAALFLSSPSFPNMIPKRQGNSWTMGSVTFTPTFLNAVPVALAPLSLFPLAIWVAAYQLHPAAGWIYLGWGWVTGNLIYACLPSRQDWRIATPTLLVLAGIGIAVTIFYFMYKRH